MPAPQRVVCILGMHRSGTSLVARLVNLLGVELGPESLIAQPAPDNPRGFWEHPTFKAIDDALLERFGGRWDAPPAFREGWHADPALDDLRAAARPVIASFASEALWGWKAPCACLTLPFWAPLMAPATVIYVIALRNAVDVAQSLAVRNAMPLDEGGGLWLAYNAAALRHTTGSARMFVSYDELMAAPAAVTRRLAAFIGHPGRQDDPGVREAIAGTIESALHHHHHSSLADLAGPSDVGFAARSAAIVASLMPLDSEEDEAGAVLGEVFAQALGDHSAVATMTASMETLRRTLEARTFELAQRTQELEERTASLGSADADRMALRARGASLEAALAQITTGAGWRLLSRYRIAIDALMPEGSSRRRVYRAAVRALGAGGGRPPAG